MVDKKKLAGRVVVEHDDGRRVSVDAEMLDDPQYNPFNRSRTVVEHDNDNNATRTYVVPERPLRDRISLKSEGFTIVGYIDEDGHEQGLGN